MNTHCFNAFPAALPVPIAPGPPPDGSIVLIPLIMRRRRRASVVVAGDFLGALANYLYVSPAILNLFGRDPWGNTKVYFGGAPAKVRPPFLTIEDYTEENPGETLDDMMISMTISIHTITSPSINGLDTAIAAGAVVKNTLDSIAINPNSTRVGGLSWTGGTETGVVRFPSRPRMVIGQRPGGNQLWREDIDYEFWVSPDQ